ncbi:pilus assembly protein PilM [bacterium]|nr:pilus assembly protein PilM [bacterium]
MTAAVRNCVGVDIGSDWIRVANLEMTRQGPRVLDLLEERIELEPDLTEDKRFIALAKQLQEMLKRAKVRTRNAIFCVPGQSVFVRRIRLPRAKPDQMNRMVRYEARQQIPFPLDKTIMEYQVFEEEGLKEVHVLLVAIKRDFINNFMKLIRRTGLKVLAISVSSIALYNFHEFNSLRHAAEAAAEAAAEGNGKAARKKGLSFGSLFKKKAAKETATAVAEPGAEEAVATEAEPEQIQAFVNLGASLMDLAISKPGSAHMIGFVRSVPLAGNEMDRAIRDKLRIEKMEQARQIKEKEVSVLSTEFEMDEDAPQVNIEASEAATSVADRIIGELRRSLDFYISQPDGVAVDSIVLSGGLVRLTHLVDYIEEKMGIPVVEAEPLHDKLRMPDAMPEHFSGFAIAIGLALQGIGAGQNRVDFLPEDIKTVRGLQERKLEVAGMIAMLIVIIMMSLNVGLSQIQQSREDEKKYAEMITKYKANADLVTQAIKRHDDVVKSVDSLKQLADVGRDYLLKFMKLLVERRPPEMLIDNIILRSDGIVVISGKARAISDINKFMDGLKDLNMIVFEPKFSNWPDQTIDPRFNSAMYSYTITLKTLPLNKGRIRFVGERPLIYKNIQPGSVGRRR